MMSKEGEKVGVEGAVYAASTGNSCSLKKKKLCLLNS